jgi:hypothetical protein
VICVGVELFTLSVELRLAVRRKVGRRGLSHETSAIKIDRVLLPVRAHFAWRTTIAKRVADDSRQQPNRAQIGVPVRSMRRGFAGGGLHHIRWSPPGFPAIEMDNDGSGGVDGQISADEYILAHAPADVKIIPGHGNLATRDDMVKILAVLKDTRTAIQAGIAQGRSLDQLKQEKAFAKWDYLNESRHIQSDVYFERLYKTLSAKNPAAGRNGAN